MSLVSGWFLTSVVAVAVLAMAASLDWRRPATVRRVLAALTFAVFGTGVLLIGHFDLQWVNYDFPISFFAWIGVALFALGLAVGGLVGWIARRRSHPASAPPVSFGPDGTPRPVRRGRWAGAGRGFAGVLSVPLAVLMAAALINGYFAYYPTVYSLTHATNSKETTLAALNAQRAAAGATSQSTTTNSGSSGVSETLELTIPATISHFNARPAYVWVPPAYVQGKVTELPVLMMLAGSLGGPSNWLSAGDADKTAQAFADQHNGIAPIMVFPDENGSATADTECVDGTRGNSETYLTQDVANFMAANFHSKIDNRSWGVVGLSGGGECALMLSLRHPQLFSVFADYSGLTSPTPTDTIDPQATADALFGGNVQTYYEHDPLHLLAQPNVPSLSGIFEVASDDRHASSQQQIVPLAQKAGLQVCSWVGPPSGHSYKFWLGAFQNSLPTLSAWLKLTPAVSGSFPGTCSG